MRFRRTPNRRSRPSGDEPNPDEAMQALIEERRRLAVTRAETDRYAELALDLKNLRERNHFAEALTHTFRGGSRER